MQNQNNVALLSGPYCSAGGYSVVPKNFEKSMILHAVRRIPKAIWLNDRDQFSRPNKEELPDDFISDCVIWSAFSQSNDTVSMKDIVYKDKIYQIENEMFPFLLSDVKDWGCDLRDIQNQLFTINEDRYLAKWIKYHRPLSQEAQAVYNAAKKLYKLVFSHLSETNWPDYKIQCWDIGWWQIRKAAVELVDGDVLYEVVRKEEENLSRKIEAKFSTFGFFPPTMEALPSTVEEFEQRQFL